MKWTARAAGAALGRHCYFMIPVDEHKCGGTHNRMVLKEETA